MKFINTMGASIFAFLAFSSLFSIINPISAAPIFVSLTDSPGIESKNRHGVPVLLPIGAGIVSLRAAEANIGAFFGITVAAFQIAGGLSSIMSSRFCSVISRTK